MMLKFIRILTDNYIWILYNKENYCIIVDPGLSDPILKEIKKHKWFPVAILLTHNHVDHTGGVKKIVKNYPKINVFGPYEAKNNNVKKIVKGGDKIFILNKEFSVFFTPGHTLGHVIYYSRPYLFCGDTVFSGGCGRVYNKKYLDMYNSIKKILSFPNETILCCSHEYTLSNLSFSMSILPEDKNIKNFYEKSKKLIKIKKTSLPSYILLEKKINLFLRVNECSIREALNLDYNCTSLEVFTKLRVKRDHFGAKRD